MLCLVDQLVSALGLLMVVIVLGVSLRMIDHDRPALYLPLL